MSFTEFILENRIKVNNYLNRVLWFFVITGPAIALGLRGGIFRDITYVTCVCISLVVIALSAIHKLLLSKYSHSIVTSIFALTALDGLLVYMNCSHVEIHLTWFLVPLLSLLFVDSGIYIYALCVNYASMALATWITSLYNTAHQNVHPDRVSYFVDVMGGFTIETVIMLASGYMIGRLTSDYFKELFENEQTMKEKMDILDSMAEIYDNVNLISFVDNTEMSLREENQQKHGIDLSNQTHTLMNQEIRKNVVPDQLEDFLNYTNITTIRERLRYKKLVSADFIDAVKGWFRAQYITVKASQDGTADTVIFTTRNVDEEKRREEHLIRISLTDEMTRLYNRRCYEEDLNLLRKEGLPDDLVLFSIDVNGLKIVNDTKGHAAGDELIKGAADCLALLVGNHGKAYRTGGDEFIALIHTYEPESLRQEIAKVSKEWHGVFSDKMSMSVGYAAVKDNKDASVDDLEHIADKDMYKEKNRYYIENGIDRRSTSR